MDNGVSKGGSNFGSLWMKSYAVAIQMKPLQQYFHMVLFM